MSTVLCLNTSFICTHFLEHSLYTFFYVFVLNMRYCISLTVHLWIQVLVLYNIVLHFSHLMSIQQPLPHSSMFDPVAVAIYVFKGFPLTPGIWVSSVSGVNGHSPLLALHYFQTRNYAIPGGVRHHFKMKDSLMGGYCVCVRYRCACWITSHTKYRKRTAGDFRCPQIIWPPPVLLDKQFMKGFYKETLHQQYQKCKGDPQQFQTCIYLKLCGHSLAPF